MAPLAAYGMRRSRRPGKFWRKERLATVREMGERSCKSTFSFHTWAETLFDLEAIARTMREFDSAVMEILSANARDVPFALIYHVDASSGTLELDDLNRQP